jgi:hypothetical protein
MSCAPLFRDLDCGLNKQSAATKACARSETVDSQNPETTHRESETPKWWLDEYGAAGDPYELARWLADHFGFGVYF